MDTINKLKLSEQVFGNLRTRILEGELKSGDRIWADDIAKELGVSMAPVKEALLLLQAEGLTSNIPRRGTVVKEFDLKEVTELYSVRRLIETEAVATAFANGGISQSTISRMSEINEAIFAQVENDHFVTISEAYELDGMFHRELVETCGNSILSDWYQKLNNQCQIVRFYSFNAFKNRGTATYEEHKKILDSLRAKDLDRVSLAIRQHLEHITSALLRSPDALPDHRAHEKPPGRKKRAK